MKVNYDFSERVVLVAGAGSGIGLAMTRACLEAGATVLVPAPASGVVHALDARAIGVAAKLLGGGRDRKGARIDWAVGVDLVAKIGDRVLEGAPLATLRVNDRARLDEAIARVQAAYSLGDEPATPPPLIKALLGAL